MATVAEAPQAKPAKAGLKPSAYIVLQLSEDNAWEEVGTYTASGPVEAQRAAVAEDASLRAALSSEQGLTLVAVNRRYWKPKTGRVTTREEIEFS